MQISPPPKSYRVHLAILAVIAGIGILAMKYYASVISGSAALRSDAIESVVNVLAAIFMLGAVLFAEKPADKKHPYGHGKIESFSAAFEGGLIALAAAFIAWEAITTLHEQLFHNTFKLKFYGLGRGLLWSLAAGILNGALGIFLVFMGRKQRSKAVEADGLHVLADFWTTLGVLAGLLLVKLTGLQWLDPLVALFVAVLLARTSITIVAQSGRALLDVEDPELLEQLIEVMNRIRPKDVIALHELRTMRSGRYTHVDVHIVVPNHYTLQKAHDIAEPFGIKVIAALGIEGELHTHIDPCQQSWCTTCAVDGCPVRTEGSTGTVLALTMENSTAVGDV